MEIQQTNSTELETVKKPTGSATTNVLLIILVVLVVVGVGVGAYFLGKQVGSDEARTSTSTSTSGNSTKVDEVSYVTYTTVRKHLKFDYPSDWNVEASIVNTADVGDSILTTITTASGYKLFLFEDPLGGIGGYCDPAEPPLVEAVLHKEASTGIKGLNVVSNTTTRHDGEKSEPKYSLYVSSFAGAFDQQVTGCDVPTYDMLINFHSELNFTDALVSFGNESIFYNQFTQDKPQASEFDAIVRVLASLRQS